MGGGLAGNVGLRKVAGHVHYGNATLCRWLQGRKQLWKAHSFRPDETGLQAFLSSNADMLLEEKGVREV